MKRWSSIVLGVALVGGCKKDDSKSEPANPKSAESSTTAPKGDGAPVAAAAAAVSAVGVEPGGIAHDAKEGPAAVLTKADGTVEVRKVGEGSFAKASADTKLYPGDVVRTQDKSTATITMADTSVVELAEVSTLGVASRDGSADPGSSAAVLSGLARFTVAQRSPGEGTFRVYTPAGMVVTKGTVYGVGVAANGSARVGVEQGNVDVVGLADLGATPVGVGAGSSLALDATGNLAMPSPWLTDDWGQWRDDGDASIQVGAAVDAHAKAMTDLEAQLASGYGELSASADRVATFEATAATQAEKNDRAGYEASLPQASADIDGSFALGGRLEALTWANAGHAELATDIYVRHPDELKASWTPVSAHVDAAALWPKRFEVTAAGYLEPLRGAYYLHTPQGRAHAELVGVTVPAFYADVTPPEIEPVKIRATVKAPVWTPPELEYHADAAARPVWIETPAPDWRVDAKFHAAPPRADVGWYVRVPQPKAHLMIGADVRGRFDSALAVRPPEPRAKLRAAWTVPVGVKIKIGAPDLHAAADARAHWGGRADIHGPDIHAKVRVGVREPEPPPMPTIRVAPPSVGIGIHAGASATVRDHRGDAGAGAAVGVRVKAPTVRIVVPKPPPIRVKAGVKVKAGFKIGL
ncbi:MAG TPA: FecR family protein [Kofleriaceae bacterium]